MTAVRAFHNTSAGASATGSLVDLKRLPPPGASPAGDLQRRVSEEVLTHPDALRENGKWPPRTRWAAIIGLGGLCWTAIAAVTALLRA